jgi:hypothetical protein
LSEYELRASYEGASYEGASYEGASYEGAGYIGAGYERASYEGERIYHYHVTAVANHRTEVTNHVVISNSTHTSVSRGEADDAIRDRKTQVKSELVTTAHR